MNANCAWQRFDPDAASGHGLVCVFRFAATGNGTVFVATLVANGCFRTEVVKWLPANLRVRLGAVAAHALAPFGTADALVVAADAVAPVGLHTGATHRGFEVTHPCFALRQTTGFLPFRPIVAGPAMSGLCGPAMKDKCDDA